MHIELFFCSPHAITIDNPQKVFAVPQLNELGRSFLFKESCTHFSLANSGGVEILVIPLLVQYPAGRLAGGKLW